MWLAVRSHGIFLAIRMPYAEQFARKCRDLRAITDISATAQGSHYNFVILSSCCCQRQRTTVGNLRSARRDHSFYSDPKGLTGVIL